MKKRKKVARVSMESGQRKALLKSLATSLFEKGKIKTTLVKAKALKGLVEKKISIAKKGLPLEKKLAKTRVLRRLFSEKTVEKIFSWAELFQNRPGGYCRIIKLPFRQSDSALMAVIEMVQMPEKKEEKKVAKKKEKKDEKKPVKESLPKEESPVLKDKADKTDEK